MANPTFAAPVSIDGITPAPPALTLKGAARIIPVTDDRWINGAALWQYGSDLPSVYDSCLPASSAGHTKPAGTPAGEVLFGSFAVVQGITCTTSGIGDPAEWQTRVKALLDARDHWGIEREFWTGALKPANPHLADPAVTPLNGGAATSVKHGIGLLEQAIADAGGDGFIHMRPYVFSQHAEEGGGEVEVSNGVARSTLGTPLVPGVGYPGSSPDADAPDDTTEWLYATGRVEIRQSGVEIVPGSMAEATDRGVNTTTFRAERYVLITWDTRIHAAVKIDRSFSSFAS